MSGSGSSSSPQSQQDRLNKAAIVIRRLQEKLQAFEQAKAEPIAIVGMGCRFPGGANSPEAYWSLLDEGRDAIQPLDSRWALIGARPGDEAPRWAGLLTEPVDRFDAEFFGIAPREARSLDPQHRLLLEVAWEAFEDARMPAKGLEGSRTGVFLGAMSTDYLDLVEKQPASEQDAYGTIGNLLSIAAGRLSYTLGLQGPCLTVDTACSAALVAVHLACLSLRARECDRALAGGVNLILSPVTMDAWSRTQALSADGRCRTFDATANGFVRGEGCGMVVLKRLSDAQRDGDRIWALIRGSAVNQDGRSMGLTAPNALAQEALLREALESARVDAASIGYVETHGTGTVLGDPIEVEALRAVLGTPRPNGERCVLGAVKTNLGHLEAAAGMAGLIKATLALTNERIPKNLHFRARNPLIEIDGTALALATEPVSWPRSERPRFAGVSSFGMSGTNAHVVLEEAPTAAAMPATQDRAAELFVLSAKNEAALAAQAARLREHLLAHPELGFSDVAASLVTTRSPMEHRLAVAATSPEGLRSALDAAAQGQTPTGVVRGRTGGRRGKVAFLFTGQGAQVAGMGRGLHAAWPAFREAFDRCVALFDGELKLGRPLREVMWAEPGSADAGLLDQTGYTQPALFTVEYALWALWRSWGVEPELVAGHSIGELVAAHVAGVFSLEDAVRLVAARGRLMQALPSGGAMVSIAAAEEEVLAAVKPHAATVSIAAVNGPAQVVIAGEAEAVKAIAAGFSARGVRTKALTVSHAFHSPLMDPMLAGFQQVAEKVKYQPATLPLVSNVSGKLAGAEVGTAAYWVRHVREAVRFADGVKALHKAGAGTFIELGPKATLLGLVPACVPETEPVLVASLRSGRDEAASILEGVGGWWAAGGAVDWKVLFPEGGRRVSLPTYAWQRQRHWLEAAPVLQRVASADRSADWFYRVDWPEAPRAGAEARVAGSGRWLVLADARGFGSAVAAALSARGQSCTLMHTAEVSVITETLAGQGDWQGVLYLGGLDAEVAYEASAEEVSGATRAAVAPLLNLVRVLGAGRRPPRLWVVTRGACAVGAQSTVAACQSALWGMGRVIAVEHPAAWGGLIDLDAQYSASEVEALVTELLSPDGEDQLAFRQGRRHVARLVSAPPESSSAPVTLSEQGSYLVTGGLGPLGLYVAQWLVERGARHLVLTGRRGLETPGAAEAVAKLEALGARVKVAAVDVADAEAMASLVNAAEPPLRGVVHAAGLVEDKLLAHQDEDPLARVLRPKVDGAWLLHTLTRERPLDLFVLFSSLAAVAGSAGQGAYAAANSFLDALATVRRGRGLPALSIGWGLWAEGGMGTQAQRREQEAVGVLAMDRVSALSALERLVSTGATQQVVAWLDRKVLGGTASHTSRNRLMERLRGDAEAPKASTPRQWRGMSVAEARPALHTLVSGIVADVLGFSAPAALDASRGFAEQGLDSLMAVQIRNRLQQALDAPLSVTLAFDHPTVERVVAHLLTDVLDLEDRASARTAHSAVADEPIAIIGAACRLPGGVDGLEDYWRLLMDERIAVTDVPADRWAPTEGPNKGGFLRQVDTFDPAFFRISPREAASLDPQQRLLLEVSWEALEESGQDPTVLRESATGVFVGIGPNEYGERLEGDTDEASALYGATGNALSFTAGRLSFFLGLHGPSLAVDTACSSSLVALHLGCRSLLQGECDRALVGGVNVLVSPRNFVALSRMRALSPDGRCKTFSADADGYGRGEGCAVVVLKRLSQAQRDGDRILAVIRGTAVNHDGPSSGLTVPSGPAQQAVLRQALAQAGAAPAEVDFIECHGTGTSLGDPIEVQALASVYGEGRPAERPVMLGAVKANLGHLEPAAGLAGVLKVALALGHERIPAQPGLSALNPHLPWDTLPVAVARQATDWPRGSRPRLAGVSSFGLSGTNAHVVLEEAPLVEAPPTAAPERSSELIVLSAKSDAALDAQAARLAAHLEAHPEQGLGDMAFSLATTRASMEQRLAVVASSREGLLEALKQAAQAQTPAGAVRGRTATGAGKVVFVFPGQGSQWLGMGRKLLAEEPAFREALEACDKAIQAEAGWSLLKELAADESTSQLGRIDVVQPVLFAVEVALAALWRAWGVEPDAVVGHSMGEVAAAYVAGALSLEDAAAIICRRSVLLRRISGQGEMAVVELSRAEAEAALVGYEDRLSVAVSNSPRSTVLAGDPKALAEVLAALEGKGVFCRRVKVDVASHSPQVEPLREDLLAALSQLAPKRATVAMRSTVTGELVEGPELLANYWADNLRQPVRFGDAVQELLDGGHGLFIEMSPHPILTMPVEEMRRASGKDGVAAGSLRRGQEERGALLETLGALWTQGYPVAWERQFPAGGQRVSLPTYAWQRERHWIDAPTSEVKGPRGRVHTGGHPLLGEALTVSTQAGMRLWETTLDPKRLPWLGDHRVQGAVVFPGAGYLEMALAAGAEALGAGAFRVTDVSFVEALVFAGEAPVEVQVVTTEERPGLLRFQVASRQPAASRDAWLVHARGSLRSVERAEAPAPVDVAGLRARPGVVMPASAAYAALGEMGLQFGPAFQGVAEFWRGEGEALGRVRLPEAAGGAQSYQVHPALLDACFQVMVGTLNDTDKAPWVPVEVGALRLLQRPHGELWCHLRIQPDEAKDSSKGGPLLRSADIRVADATGALVAEVTGLVVRRLASEASHDEQDGWFMELAWEPANVPAAKSVAGRFLLLGDGGGVGAALRTALEASGHTVIQAVAGAAGKVPAGVLPLNDSNAASVRALLTSAFRGQAPTAVVHLRGLEGEGTLEASAVEAALARGCDSVLATVQAVTEMGYRDAPRLWVLTRGAQPTGGGEVAVAQAPVLGLGRAIAMEHPELRCARVDLDPSRPGEELQGLVAELLADDAEDEVALRGRERRVARLVRKTPESGSSERLEPANGRSFRLEIDKPGVLDDLLLRVTERRPPGPGEVEIAVEAAGLNFLDVLLALGVMPDDMPGAADGPLVLGGECAGRIVAVGEGVSGLSVGQPVIALARASFASHVTAPAALVVPRPDSLSASQGAAIPIVYLTAWYALSKVARLQKGERVLIHAATGGVGLAAVQWAQHVGAEVYATAGTPEKRAYLQSLGVKYVSDSRSDRFVSDVLEWTGGEGVDVVLNSLSGELIAKSFALLRSHGRFVELGKRDYYANNQLGLRPFLRNLSFSLVDLRGMSVERPAWVRALLEELLGLFAQGVVRGLPVESFPVSRAADAFQKMAQGHHIGKLVLALEDPEARIRVRAESGASAIRGDGSYLITGGLGGLGLSVAGWLAEKGAGHVVLMGRSGAANAEQQAAVAALEARGTRVTVAKADVAERAHVERVLDGVRSSGMPLRGVIHAAGLLDDGLLLQQTPARLRKVMAPKVQGALHLHTLTRGMPLDFFVLYASGAGILGSPGQGNYAAANTFLDALAHHRRREGLPGLSIDWGAFSGVGLAAAQENRGARLASRGLRNLTADEGLVTLERLLQGGSAQSAVLPFDVRQWVEFYPAAASSPLLSRLRAEQPHERRAVAGDGALAEKLAAAAPEARATVLLEFLRGEAARVLRIAENKFDTQAPLTSLGMDSLMGLELRNRIEGALGIKVPATLLWTYPTVLALSRHLAGEATETAPAEAPPPPKEDLTAAIEAMSQDELMMLIAEEAKTLT
ncbi:SDR family NAD(P)-dependent oxidoreductase [Pyxidicoccus fallax]|uniref:SDR family NAD(P)-dependent oxidoreductase n=1 Tax=Pyxidicoccus fallax TaxID=394095 RepID=A0A848LK54_9BACT|nr:type I polyketide synthase [Pyxidicoccus fallax]NMO18054.1 SDR family NAD(P)-dependent oxidoreductase [Pyxidicoccus fallax]NPC79681.1 SDR family NAD(P)-dependent oxidoreductase [Pyxidicoccus fallax]